MNDFYFNLMSEINLLAGDAQRCKELVDRIPQLGFQFGTIATLENVIRSYKMHADTSARIANFFEQELNKFRTLESDNKLEEWPAFDEDEEDFDDLGLSEDYMLTKDFSNEL